MTDKITDPKEEAVNVSHTESPGTQLRKAREKMGLTQEEVANNLHLRASNIQDIEADKHQESVSITFTKGYVRTYAKLVGLDSEPLLQAFDDLHRDERSPAKLHSFSQRVAKEAHDERWMMVTYLVVFLVVGSVVIWWFQQSDKSIGTRFDELSSEVVEQVKNLGGDTESDENQVAAESVEQLEQTADSIVNAQPETDPVDIIALPESEAQERDKLTDTLASEAPLNQFEALAQSTDSTESEINEQVETPDSSVNRSSEELVAETVESEEPTEDIVQEQKKSDEPEQLTEEPKLDLVETDDSEERFEASEYSVNSDGTVELVFTFKDDCWVSVRDVNKETIAYGVKKKGRIMTVSGIPPIRVILGAPQNVEIDFGGQPVDMNIFPAGRSANFQLPLEGE